MTFESLPPFYHTLVSFAGPSSISSPVGIPKTLVSFPDWFRSILYSFTLKTLLSPCTRVGTLLNTEITVVFSKHSDFNGLPMLYSTFSLYEKFLNPHIARCDCSPRHSFCNCSCQQTGPLNLLKCSFLKNKLISP